MQASNVQLGHVGHITLGVLLAFCLCFPHVGSHWVKPREKLQNASETTHSVIRHLGLDCVKETVSSSQIT